MQKSLPPLSALRAFEAVARHTSFSRAADELHVTPSAVSQQVRLLEQLLGETLFLRTKRTVALTEAATRMLPDIQAGFESLARATTNRLAGPALTISVAPSFASKWLLPRLGDFSDRHPDIDLRISATVALADFKRDNVDLAIRLGRGSYPALQSEPLFAETLTPLCSPALLLARGRLKNPDDLRMHRLIHDTSIPGENEQGSWDRWLKRAGATQVNAYRGTRFSLAELALQAAIDGAGVVMARTVLAESDLAAGRLVMPFKIVLPLDVSYFLVMAKGNTKRREIQCFRDWLYDQLRPRLTGKKARRAKSLA
jgi:LysR family glycine cleavage system transcriptional activator